MAYGGQRAQPGSGHCYLRSSPRPHAFASVNKNSGEYQGLLTCVIIPLEDMSNVDFLIAGSFINVANVSRAKQYSFI